MSSVSVTCGCGRKMREVGNAPRGTFLCGCGARVVVEVAERDSTCAGLTDAGPCRFRPSRESAELGLRICDDHLERLKAMVNFEELNEAQRQVYIADQAAIWAAYMDATSGYTAEELRELEDLRERYAAQSVVYYVRIGEHIKIGTTINMQRRMSELLPDEVLATEPGDIELERMRHKQLAAFRANHRSRERYHAAEPLLTHIAMIRAHFGEPQMTTWLRTASGKRLLATRPTYRGSCARQRPEDPGGRTRRAKARSPGCTSLRRAQPAPCAAGDRARRRPGARAPRDQVRLCAHGVATRGSSPA